MSTPIGRYGTIAVVSIALCKCVRCSVVALILLHSDLGYKKFAQGSSDMRKDDHYKRATADYQQANAHGTDVKK